MATCKAGDIYDQPFFRGVDWRAVEELRVEPPFKPEVVSSSDRDAGRDRPAGLFSACVDKIKPKMLIRWPFQPICCRRTADRRRNPTGT
jgi:hypothetical protein